MFNRALIVMLACHLVVFSIPSTANAKPSAPIDIEKITPETIRIGEEVRSVIRFTAKTDLQHIDVSFSPYSGIELLSHKRHIEFFDLKRNDHREIELRIKLTRETGYLSVFARTTSMAGNTQTRSIAIRYGTPSDTLKRKPSRKNGTNNASGERLILLPGSPR